MLHLAFTLALALAPTAPSAPQGAVWTVGPSGADFTTIKDAVDAASDGDTVLVKGGGYGPFPITGKALNVVAEAGTTVTVGSWSPFGETMTFSQLPAGSTTVVRGIDFHAPQIDPFTYAQYGVQLSGCSGTVWFEDCSFDNGPKGPLWIENCGDVVLERCSAKGTSGYTSTMGSKPSGPAIVADGVRLTIHGGVIEGGNGIGSFFSADPSAGLPGIHVTSGELYLSGCQVIGGKGGAGDPFGNCPSLPPDGGPAVRLDDGVLRLLAASLVGGAPGTLDPGCTQASQGPSYVLGTATATQLSGTPSWLVSNSPVREGQNLTVRLTTTAGTPLTALLLAGQATDPIFVAPLSGVGLLSGPTRRIGLGTVDPLTGIATFQLTIPDLGPGVLVEPWIFQAYVCGSGGCTAGAATHTVWLDSSL